MLSNTLKTRGVAFAYIFGPPRFVQREEAFAIHNAVCAKLALDDIAFQYSTKSPEAKPDSKGFLIRLERKEGRGGFHAEIGSAGGEQPMRLLMTYEWPPSTEHLTETFDMTSSAVFSTLEGNCQRVMAEVRIKAQCEVQHESGLQFMRKRVLRLATEQINGLGNSLEFASLKLEVAPSATPETSLSGPKRELSIELLREDPKGIYIEFMSQWAQFPPTRGSAPLFDVSRARSIDQNPSDYVEEAYTFLRDHVMVLGEE